MIAVVFQCVLLCGSALAIHPQEDIVPMKALPFPLSDIRLFDGYAKTEQEKDLAYLLDLDSDRLLYTFRTNAGLDAPGEPLGGWEKPESEVRGHFIGHYLSACALMFASTGDERIKAKADAMITELGKCQQALGGEYLAAFPESFWDRLESLQQVPWAAYYTIHKIMAGLYDLYALCGNEQALDMLSRMAAYFGKRMDRLSQVQIDKILAIEYGGMSEVLHNLYAITGDPAHLHLAHLFDRAAFLGPLALEHDNLTQIHGNTHIPIVYGAARHYELTGDTRYRVAAEYFWKQVVTTRSYATGGSTMFEHWPEPGRLTDTLGTMNHECCKTHNMLKLTRYLFRWTADPHYADFYEQAWWNGILGTQGSEPGQFSYYIAMAPGFPRVFGDKYNDFWCCYGTGVESFAKLGDSIYFHDAGTVYVNLFVPSRVTWREKGLTIDQHTGFPSEDATALTVHTEVPTAMTLAVRLPAWAQEGVSVTVNGEPVPGGGDTAGERPSYARVSRTWNDGDTLRVRMPMRLHTQALPDDPERVAILYGPLVLAAIVESASGADAHLVNHHEGLVGLQQSVPPLYVLGDPAHPEMWVHQRDGLNFDAESATGSYRLVPFYRVTNERYALYWDVTSEGSERHHALQEEAAMRAREIDRVFMRNEASDKAHDLKGEKTETGIIPCTSRCFRHAMPGGWWSWQMAVKPDAPVSLACTYYGNDVGRTFDILVDGEVAATQALNAPKPGGYLVVEYPIPETMTRGKDHVCVTFRGKDTMVGGVFDCAMLTR